MCFKSSLIISEYIEREIQNIKTKFEELKAATWFALNTAQINMYELFYKVRNLPVRLEQEKQDIHREADKYRKRQIEPSFFAYLFSCWDYLNPDIYDHIITSFSLTRLHPLLTAYRKELDAFLRRTPPEIYCEIERTRVQHITSPRGYRQVEVRASRSCFELLRNFRMTIAKECNVPPYAVIVVNIGVATMGQYLIMRTLVPER